jgi:hypothetical protein
MSPAAHRTNAKSVPSLRARGRWIADIVVAEFAVKPVIFHAWNVTANSSVVAVTTYVPSVGLNR